MKIDKNKNFRKTFLISANSAVITFYNEIVDGRCEF